jgi:hypothetical protein
LISWKTPAALFFIKPWLDGKIEGKKEREKRAWERKREKGKEEPKNCVRKSNFYLEINKKQEKKEGIRELRRQREDILMTVIPTAITPPSTVGFEPYLDMLFSSILCAFSLEGSCISVIV